MRRGRVVLLALTLCILVVDCRGADAEGKVGELAGAAAKNTSADLIKPAASLNGQDDKAKNPIDKGSQPKINNNPEGEKIRDAGAGAKAKPVEEPKKQEEKGEAGGSSSENLSKVNARVEECDASNRCIYEKRNLVACLRIPGNDAPTLSLFILNKGDAALEVTILAPKYLNVEEASISLPAKQNKKVMVTVEKGVEDIPIALSSGDWRCNLSFWEMIPDSVKSSTYYAGPSYLYFSSKGYIIFAAVLLALSMVLAYSWKRSRQAHIQGQGYQKVDVSLPVSSGGVKEIESTETWDDSWGDNWDDEEAPVTPSNPAFSLSSKGLASRKSNKDGWMD